MKNKWFWIHLLVFTIFSAIAFYRNLTGLFASVDGLYVLHTVSHQAKWLPFVAGFSVDFLQGFGDMFFLNNFTLEPAYAVPLLLFGNDTTSSAFQVMSYTIFSIELFLATYVLARELAISFEAAIIAAWLAALLIMPYFHKTMLYPITSLSPHRVSLIAASLLIFAIVAHLGKRQNKIFTVGADYFFATALLLIVTWLCVVYPSTALIWVPVTAVGSLGLIASSHSKHELIIKITLLTVAAAIFVALGFIPFIYGILSYSTAFLLPDKLTVSEEQLTYAASWFFSPSVGRPLIMFALGGIALSLFRSKRRLKYFGVACLLCMVMIFGLCMISIFKADWHGPRPIIFEAQLWPVYCIFASYLLCEMSILIFRRLSVYVHVKPLLSNLNVHALLLVVTVAGALFLQHPLKKRNYPIPSVQEPMIAKLGQEVGMQVGAAYKGRVASFLLSERTKPVGWSDMLAHTSQLSINHRNDYFWEGLWLASIPTVFEYSQSMSPAFFYTAIKLLGREYDPQTRNVIVLRKPNYHNLALLGVAYVISDRTLSKPFQLQYKKDLGLNKFLYLYKLPDANVTGFSPTHTMAAKSLNDAIKIISQDGFDPSKTFVSDGLFTNKKLVPANNIQLITQRGKLHVSANSKGESLVVLPFEYSNCLDLIAKKSQAKLVRVNGIQIGVLFSKSLNADIAYRYSPWMNSFCRIHDGQWFKAHATIT